MLDNLVIVAYFIVVFGIGIYHSRRQRTTSEYFLAGHSIGWFAVGASLVFHQHFERALHRPRRFGRIRRTRRGLLRMVRQLLPVHSRLALRAVLPEVESVHDARVSRAALQFEMPLVSHHRFTDRLYLHQDFGAPVCRRDSHALRARVGLPHHVDPAGPRDRYLHHHRRPESGHLHRPLPVFRAPHRRDRSDVDRARVTSGAFHGLARGTATRISST